MKSASGVQLPRIGVVGKWKHAASVGHQGMMLRITPRGIVPAAGRPGTRFNPGELLRPRFELLYLALEATTTLLEKRAMYGDSSEFLFSSRMAQTIVVDVEVDLRTIVDLTDPRSHALLDTSAQEMTGDWAGYEQRRLGALPNVLSQPTGVAPTQTLGWELFREPGIEGIKAISAKVPTTCTLVIFTHKLMRPGSLAWDDPNTGNRERYP